MEHSCRQVLSPVCMNGTVNPLTHPNGPHVLCLLLLMLLGSCTAALAAQADFASGCLRAPNQWPTSNVNAICMSKLMGWQAV